MPKSKHRKKHGQKLKVRRENILQEKKRVEKLKREFIMNLIENEKKMGLFDNAQTIPTQNDVNDLPMGPII
jgi:hypothetical protein